jgi:hypothetical protein
MTQVQLNNQLTIQLKAFLKQRNHISSGNLYKSIKITSDSNLNFKLNAYEYIQFLDEGTFLTDFFALPKTVMTISDYLTGMIDKELDITG